MMNRDERLVFEKSVSGRVGYSLPKNDVPEVLINAVFPKEMLRDTMAVLPEVSEVDVIRHYTKLSQRNYGVDSGFYPLGSCTMKYNPKINEDIAAMDGFCQMHPLQNPISAQGSLEILYKTDRYLSEILGMEKATLQPAAGAQGEMTGLMIIKAYHMSRKDEKRVKIIVPDSSHGTNPASAALAGFEVTHIPSNERGCIDIDALKELMDDTVAGLMLTNPNTLGLFEKDILQISEMVHNCGGLLYYDGANMNAIMGIARPGDMGFDIAHVNLHKTFSTPHGGGGPGSGPIAVVKELVPYLPSPVIEKEDDYYVLDYDRPLSIGKVKSFYGNFAVVLKAYCYIRIMGAEGLKEASTAAVLNANYVRKSLEDYYDIPQNRVCMHEFVLSAKRQAENGITALDIAKNLLDKGYHPPTIYFPMIVSEAMMIEPTETESPETLDAFIEAMIDIAKRAEVNPETLVNAPKTTYVSRLDEVKAARTPVLRWK